ncbi:TetR/AcrR family transcriptional regulator [Shimia sp. SDUM112013]|uniref:TetR/AcrR family transcriptional regulator n=1 Tax=Shimia sp. SDUM112013 TaxID=3136160 RepID=UPI0032EFF253
MSSEALSTRTRILKSAWDLLESGAGKTRMSDIAKAAGISRQAVYLHFPNRAELLIATTRYIDEVKDVDARLAASRSAPSGEARLEAFIAAWGNYIPEIYGVACALMALEDSDPEARLAWDGRMTAVREGCAAAVTALQRDGMLQEGLSPEEATDLLWVQLSVPVWEQLVKTCGWSQARYIELTTQTARRALLPGGR